MANWCDIRNDLNEVAEDALPRIPPFGSTAILLDVIRLRPKEHSRRVILSLRMPDLASARTNRSKFQIGFFFFTGSLASSVCRS